MATIFKTTKAEKHWHIIFYDQESGQPPKTSVDNDHEHPVQIVVDPMTQAPRLSIGEANGHTHEPESLNSPLPLEPGNKDNQKIAENDLELFKAACSYEEASRKKAHEAWDFYKGEQWDKSMRQELESKKRAVQVYNYVQAKVDILSGIARQNRVDPRAYPVEGSDEGVADVATAALMRVSKQNNMANQDIRVFEDEVIAGRGLFHIGMTQKRNPLGDVLIERFPWADGYFGPHSNLDGSDATHMHKAKWLSIAEAKAKYPDYKDDIEGMVGISDADENRTTLIQDANSKASSIERLMHDPEIIDRNHRRVRIIEHEIREFRTAYILENAVGNLNLEVSSEVHRKAKTIPELIPLEFERDRLRVSITLGTLLLKNHYPDRPYEGFSLVPVYAYKFDDGDWCGKVESMKGPQREINKRGSQSIDLVNRMLGRGWFYDADTFDDPKEENKFLSNAGGSGWFQKIADVSRPPAPAELPPFPTELFNMHSLNVSIMEGVSNINPGMSGVGKTGYESGATLATQQRSGLVGNEKVFDNFILSKQTLYRKVFQLIKAHYSKERIARIVLSEASDPSRLDAITLNGQEVPPQRDPQADAELYQSIVKMLETANLEDYDIQIGEQAFSATSKEAQFMQWMEAAAHGMQVPPGMLIELSSLPNKGKWGRMMQQMQEQQMQMEQMKYQAEMEKAGRVPPSGAVQ